MNKTVLFQLVRVAAMVLAVAGIIYALEYLPRGKALWFWVALLGLGFTGLLYGFQATRRKRKSR